MAAHEIAGAFSGAPSVLWSTSLAPLDDLGLDTLYATLRGQDLCLSRQPGASGDLVETSHLPADLLAIVAPTEEAGRICALWSGWGQTPPPVIAVDAAAQALGPLLACVGAGLSGIAARCQELQLALVETRAEFEETRVAMHGLMRTTSHRYHNKMNLAAVAPPAPGETCRLGAGGVLRRTYPIGTELVTCLALHVAEAELTGDAALTIVLMAAESHRILGQWRVPGAGVAAGWNTFDLPVPVSAVRGTVELEISLQGPSDQSVTFSLSEKVTTDPVPAIRVWTADLGGRFPYAAHWDWNAAGQTRLPPGTVSQFSTGMLGRISARGALEVLESGGQETPAFYRLRKGTSLLSVAEVEIAGFEAACAELRWALGDAAGVRFELLAQTAEGDSFTSGQRTLNLTERTLHLGLSLPPTLPAVVDLHLRIDSEAGDDGGFGIVELRRFGVVGGDRRDLPSVAVAQRIDAETLQPADRRDGPRFTGLKATNFTEQEKYSLFEVALSNLEFDRGFERLVKFKMIISNGRLALEFRRGEAWPEMFQQWPGRNQDRWGDVFHINQTESGLSVGGELTVDADRQFILALCRLTPAMVSAGAQSFPEAAERIETWFGPAFALAGAASDLFGPAVGT